MEYPQKTTQLIWGLELQKKISIVQNKIWKKIVNKTLTKNGIEGLAVNIKKK